MDEQIFNLLQENNAMLKEILALLRKFDSEEYQSQEDMRQFCINVSADIFVELLESNKELKNKIKNNFAI